MIHDPVKRHYLHLALMYLKWFKLRFPNHPLSKIDSPSMKYVMQTIRGIQGTKDAGHEWYNLLPLIFTNVLGMLPSTPNKGLYYWERNGQYSYLALATDDMLLASSCVDLFNLVCSTFDS